MGGLDYLVRCLPSRRNHLRNILENPFAKNVCLGLIYKYVHTLISYFLDVDPPPNVNVALEQVDPSESTNTIKIN